VGVSDPTLGGYILLTCFPKSSLLYELFVTAGCGSGGGFSVGGFVNLNQSALFSPEFRLKERINSPVTMANPSVSPSTLKKTQDWFKHFRYTYNISEATNHMPFQKMFVHPVMNSPVSGNYGSWRMGTCVTPQSVVTSLSKQLSYKCENLNVN
jgi:hypothetical protein